MYGNGRVPGGRMKATAEPGVQGVPVEGGNTSRQMYVDPRELEAGRAPVRNGSRRSADYEAGRGVRRSAGMGA